MRDGSIRNAANGDVYLLLFGRLFSSLLNSARRQGSPTCLWRARLRTPAASFFFGLFSTCLHSDATPPPRLTASLLAATLTPVPKGDQKLSMLNIVFVRWAAARHREGVVLLMST